MPLAAPIGTNKGLATREFIKILIDEIDPVSYTHLFLFLCAMFLCGAAAGGLTGLRAGEGDGAAVLSGLLAELPAHRCV